MPAQLDWEWNGKPNTLLIVKQEMWIDPTQGVVQRDDSAPARHHARIGHDGSGFFIETVGAAKALVNGVATTRRELRDGDVIVCAGVEVRFAERRQGRRPNVAPAPTTVPVQIPGNAELVELRERVGYLEREQIENDTDIERLRAKLEQRDSDLRRIEAELQTKVRDVQLSNQQVAALREQLELGTERLTENERLLAHNNATLDDTEKRLREERREMADVRAELARVEARCKELGGEAVSARKDSEAAREGRKSVQAELAAATQENAKLQHNLNKVSTLLAEYQQKVERLEVDDDVLKREHADRAKIIDELQRANTILGDARVRVEIMFQDLQKRHHALDVDHQLTLGEKTKLVRENAILRGEVDRMHLEAQRRIEQTTEDSTHRDALTRNQQLHSELADAQTTIIRLRADADTFMNLRNVAETRARELQDQATRVTVK